MVFTGDVKVYVDLAARDVAAAFGLGSKQKAKKRMAR
jgi:hypothetical protein